jgi:hypothetical protein
MAQVIWAPKAIDDLEFIWTDENIDHIAQHDVTPEEFEYVVKHPERRDVSHSSGLPCCWGSTLEGRFLFCVYETIDDMTVYPVTAYEPSEG